MINWNAPPGLDQRGLHIAAQAGACSFSHATGRRPATGRRSQLAGALLSQRVRAQRSEETQRCCGSGVRSRLFHLNGISLGKHPLAFDRCELKSSLWFVPSEPRVYLIPHISQCCYISSSLPCLHPPFVFHHRSTGNPFPLTRVESFNPPVSQNYPD